MSERIKKLLSRLSDDQFLTVNAGELRNMLAAAAPEQTDGELRGALEDVRELIEGYVDVVDGDYGQPRPNKAMRAVRVIDAALWREGVKG
jgi:hypothetical protein